MMTALAYVIGLGLPALNGWLLLGLIANGYRVLDRIERWTAGAVIGMTVTMFVTFCLHIAAGLPLSLTGFLAVQGGIMVALGGTLFVRKKTVMPEKPEERSGTDMPRWIRRVLWLLVGWVLLRTAAIATVFLLLSPTFLDDALDNWNLRGKIYYETQAITLTLPGENPDESRTTIGSYPPALPMAKAWLASVRGEWTDPVANGIHFFYYCAALILVARTVRRLAGKGWDLLAVYILGSLPLYLMHGTNQYADVFLSVHILLAVLFPLRALCETDRERRMALLRMGAVCAALLPFLKNEGLIVYLPPLLLVGGAGLAIAVRRKAMTVRDAVVTLAWYTGCLLVLALPWIAFKWANGLTFGNAKSVSDIGLAWQKGVPIALTVNVFFEGNWILFFPLIIGLLFWRYRAAFGRWLPLTAYVLIVTAGQLFIFLFTPLGAEARMQTGVARASVQLMPAMILLVSVLLADAGPIFSRGFSALGLLRKEP
jgi:hypothetical protein